MTGTRLPSPPEEDAPIPWGWLGVLTLLALVLRVIGLDGGLWYDEIRTLLDSVRRPLATIVTVFPSNNQHPLFSVLAHLSIGVFGDHAWSLRVPAMLMGVASVPMLYFLAREFAGRTEALLASLLLAVTYQHVWFSQNARGYSILGFLTLLSTWLLLQALRRGTPGHWVGYSAAAALGVYTHLTMVFLVASHAVLCGIALGLTVDRERWRTWRLPLLGFTLAVFFTALLYAPVLLEVQQFFAYRPSPMLVATPKWALLELLRGLDLGVGTWVVALVGGIIFVLGLWSYFRQSPFIVGLFLLPGVLTIVAAVGLKRPIFPRFLFFLVGFAVLIVVRGALTAGRMLSRPASGPGLRIPGVGVALIALMAISSLIALIPNYRYPKQDFEGAMRFVETQRVEGEPVVTTGLAASVYRDYFHRDWERVSTPEELEAIRGRGRRVWGLYTLEAYIASQTPALMETIRTECKVEKVFRGTLGQGHVTVCTFP